MMSVDESPSSTEIAALKELAATIAEFRQEFMDKTRQDFERELDAIVDNGFDPALGRGRGPRWAEGG